MAVTAGFEVLPGEQKPLIPVKKKPTRRQGGHECEFVDKPPEIVQTECPVCLQVLCKPYMVTCCCHSFCKSCIERLGDNNKPCPLCNAKFDIVHEKKLERTLNDFKVYCSYQKAGCDWKGLLGQLHDHLNEEPQDEDHQLTGCLFAELQCTHCKGYLERRNLRIHKSEQCTERPYSCDYCCKYASTHRDVTTKHWPVCACRPVPCPNECGIYPEKQNLNTHVTNDCPLTVVECEFNYAGCEAKLPRKDMTDHVTNNTAKHMIMVANTNKKQIEELRLELVKSKASIDELKNENQLLSKEVDELWRFSMPTPPCKFTLEDVSRHKSAKDWWYSPIFYSHRKGCKLCLGVHIHENSIQLCMMPGEYDDQQTWPIMFSVKVKVFNHQNGCWVLIYNYDSLARRSCKQGRKTWFPFNSNYSLILPAFINNNCVCLELTLLLCRNYHGQ